MLSLVPRAVALLALVLALSACTGGPQQPSDVIDDKSTQSAASAEGGGTVSPDFRELDAPAATDPLSTGSAPADLSAVTGRWAPTEADCANDDAAVTISPSRFASIGRICEIADRIPGGNGSVTASLACPRSDGLSDRELVKLSPTNGGLDVSVIGGDGAAQSLVRCP